MDAAKFILDQEARRGPGGRLAVYKLPAGDGGGTYEIAGINDRYHPVEAARLKELIEAGRHADAEAQALLYIGQYVAGPAAWSTRQGVSLFLADTAFNRGHGGAAWILQHAMRMIGPFNIDVDGAFGPKTRAALRQAERDPVALIKGLHRAREHYERIKAKRNESSPFWAGLKRRWDLCRDAALEAEAAAPKPPVKTQAATIATGGGAVGLAALAADETLQSGLSFAFQSIHAYGPRPILIGLGLAVIAVGAWSLYRKWRQ